jgi:uncharacterized protein (TIGR00255 family)
MIRSMTAFARQEADTGQGVLSWEVRTLNHRYLETGVRLPEELRAVEAAVRERAGKRLGRGKLECTCRYRPAAAGTHRWISTSTASIACWPPASRSAHGCRRPYR